MLDGLARELKLHEDWRQTTLESMDPSVAGVEIVETEEGDGWREQHREKVRQYRKRLAEMKSQETGPPKTQEDLQRRLDELELQEELLHELDR